MVFCQAYQIYQGVLAVSERSLDCRERRTYTSCQLKQPRAHSPSMSAVSGQSWAKKHHLSPRKSDQQLSCCAGPKRRYLGGDDMKKGPQMPPDDMKKKEAPPQVLVSSSQLTPLPPSLSLGLSA